MFPKHFDGKRFFNPGGHRARGLWEVLRWKLTSRPEPSPKFIPDVKPTVPAASVDGLEITMVNHATVLIQTQGVNILTDPIWSRTASPFRWAGPARFREPGIRFEDLPRIDVVLLSHNHYDHFDVPTLRRIRAEYVAPLGLKEALRGFGPVRELDWGGSMEVHGLRIHSVPAQHFSARGVMDRDQTLWCGFWLETNHGPLYFAADTGFGEHFGAIQRQFGSPRVALLPIGAYLPRWFMQPVHMSPEEALDAHRILQAETSIAIHHGTFQLADDAPDTAAAELRRLLGGEDFRIVPNGGRVSISPR